MSDTNDKLVQIVREHMLTDTPLARALLAVGNGFTAGEAVIARQQAAINGLTERVERLEEELYAREPHGVTPVRSLVR